MTALLAHDQAGARMVINRIAETRGLPTPWPDIDVPLPEWLADADLSRWGVVELGEMRQRLLEPRRRAAHGVVYTPPEIVDFQVPAALQAADLDRLAGHPRPLRHITIHDPFCGPGIYLIHAARHITTWYLAQAGVTATPAMTRWATATVLTECIYGNDLDEAAIDIARGVCWLEIDGICPITFMDDNIAAGDTFANHLPPKLLKRWPL